MPMMNAGYLRTGIFGLPIDEARFSVRGFNRASPARARLEQVGTSVVHYYNLAVAEGCGDNLAEYLGFISNELCGFAHEGAAMGLFAIDALAPFSRGNFDRFIRGPAKNHVYMSFIGGLAIRGAPSAVSRAVSKYAHFSRLTIRQLLPARFQDRSASGDADPRWRPIGHLNVTPAPRRCRVEEAIPIASAKTVEAFARAPSAAVGRHRSRRDLRRRRERGVDRAPARGGVGPRADGRSGSAARVSRAASCRQPGGPQQSRRADPHRHDLRAAAPDC